MKLPELDQIAEKGFGKALDVHVEELLLNSAPARYGYFAAKHAGKQKNTCIKAALVALWLSTQERNDETA